MKENDESLILWRQHVFTKIGLDRLARRNILDAGCGYGFVSSYLAMIGKRVTAFDITRYPTWKSYKAPNLSFQVADGEKMPFRSGSFDGVFLQDMLHHAEHPERVIEEIDRVTRKGAIILLVEANRYNPILYLHMTKMHGHEHFSRSRFHQMVRKQFPNAEFGMFDSHYIPFVPTSVYMVIAGFIEAVFELVPFLRPFRSYNFAVIRK